MDVGAIGPKLPTQEDDRLLWDVMSEEAEAAIMPHFPRLRKERAAVVADCRQPLEVLVPKGWPLLLHGGRIAGLPIRFGDVDEPTLIAEQPSPWGSLGSRLAL